MRYPHFEDPYSDYTELDRIDKPGLTSKGFMCPLRPHTSFTIANPDELQRRDNHSPVPLLESIYDLGQWVDPYIFCIRAETTIWERSNAMSYDPFLQETLRYFYHDRQLPRQLRYHDTRIEHIPQVHASTIRIYASQWELGDSLRYIANDLASIPTCKPDVVEYIDVARSDGRVLENEGDMITERVEEARAELQIIDGLRRMFKTWLQKNNCQARFGVSEHVACGCDIELSLAQVSGLTRTTKYID